MGSKTRFRCSIQLIILAAVAACSPLQVAERFLAGDKFIRTTNVQYGGSLPQRLDVYRERGRRGPLPVIVFLYGGRWQGGSKNDYQLLGSALTQRGFVVVVPDYSMFPRAIFPAWVKDAAQAVRWVRNNIHRFGGDSDQVWVVGHSSGAHTAVMLAVDQRYLREAGLPSGAVRGFVSLAGPVDTIWTDPDIQALMGPQERWPSTYPRNHIDGSDAPILFLHGSADRTVSTSNSTGLAARIKARGGCAKVILYPGVGHIEIVAALSEPRLGRAPVMGDVISFIADSRRECDQTSGVARDRASAPKAAGNTSQNPDRGVTITPANAIPRSVQPRPTGNPSTPDFSIQSVR